MNNIPKFTWTNDEITELIKCRDSIPYFIKKYYNKEYPEYSKSIGKTIQFVKDINGDLDNYVQYLMIHSLVFDSDRCLIYLTNKPKFVFQEFNVKLLNTKDFKHIEVSESNMTIKTAMNTKMYIRPYAVNSVRGMAINTLYTDDYNSTKTNEIFECIAPVMCHNNKYSKLIMKDKYE